MTLRYLSDVAKRWRKGKYLMNLAEVVIVVARCGRAALDGQPLRLRSGAGGAAIPTLGPFCGAFDAFDNVAKGRAVAPFAATRRKHDSGWSEFAGARLRIGGRRSSVYRAGQGIAHLGCR